MNRRSFFQMTAAPSAAVAIGARAEAGSQIGETSNQASHSRRPIEIDLEDPAAAAWLHDPEVSIFVHLLEADPGDPGQLSGCQLRILEGQAPRLTVETDAIQRDGSVMTHSLGYLDCEGLGGVIAPVFRGRSEFATPLRELHFPERFYGQSGVSLLLVNTCDSQVQELRIEVLGHIFGVLRAPILTGFLDCLRSRCAAGRGAAE